MQASPTRLAPTSRPSRFIAILGWCTGVTLAFATSAALVRAHTLRIQSQTAVLRRANARGQHPDCGACHSTSAAYLCRRAAGYRSLRQRWRSSDRNCDSVPGPQVQRHCYPPSASARTGYAYDAGRGGSAEQRLGALPRDVRDTRAQRFFDQRRGARTG